MRRLLSSFLVLALHNVCASLSTSEPLMLTPLLDAGEIERAQRLSQVTEPSFYNGTSHAGFLTVNQTLGNHLFFWFFPSMKENSDAPLLIWLNGGPGVSSMLGLLWENGPTEVDEDQLKKGSFHFVPREFTWVRSFSMLYIDNPVPVGYSFSESGEEGWRLHQKYYTEDLYAFIVQFYRLFPEYGSRELYIGGQSYAGKYVPAIAHRIHLGNRNSDAEIPLAGIYLGGPYFDPETENVAFYDFSFAMGFISKAQKEERQKKISKLFKDFKEGKATTDISKLMPLLWVDIGLATKDNFVTQQRAPYYMVKEVMSLHKIKQAVHAGDRPFSSTTTDMYLKFGEDLLVSTKPQMVDLLNNYKVLIFTGDYDVIINSAMVEAALMATPWSLNGQYQKASRSAWFSDSNTLKGYYSQTGQFCRVVIHGAGHQVPYDEPESAYDMMVDFVHHGCIQQAKPVQGDF